MKKKNSIEKPYIKRLNNIYILCQLPFYNEFGIVKISKAFKGYARSYNFERIDSNDPSVQFTISKSSIEDLLKGRSGEIKVFKYQVTLEVLSSKYRENTGKEFIAVYFS